jgi:hypothetical protein
MHKNSRLAGLILLGMGVLSLSWIIGRPRIEALHGSDIVTLIAVGMLFGGAILGLLGRLKTTVE